MQAMREWLGAEEVSASFVVDDGHAMELVAAEDGVELFWNGQAVPMKDGSK